MSILIITKECLLLCKPELALWQVIFERLYIFVFLIGMRKKPLKQWHSAMGALVGNHTYNECIRLTDHLWSNVEIQREWFPGTLYKCACVFSAWGQLPYCFSLFFGVANGYNCKLLKHEAIFLKSQMLSLFLAYIKENHVPSSLS